MYIRKLKVKKEQMQRAEKVDMHRRLQDKE
jgi:hypothetical protein